jgi:hypothetical protein
VDTVIGILELLAWVVAVLALSAAVTWAVIRVTKRFEARRHEPEQPEATPGS